MEEQEIKVTEYLVPANVSTKFEFFPGFGWNELKYVGISLLVGVLIFFLLGIPKKNIDVDVNGMKLIEIEGVEIPKEEITQKQVPSIPVAPRILPIIGLGAISYFLVKRDASTGMSLIYMVKARKAFSKNQKRYMYIYNSGTEGN